MEPKVTVVIPAYNAAKYISATIQSMLNQTLADWELVIVNDGSKDNTVEMVSPFLSDKRIQLISQQNKGVSAARNTGIRAAKAPFIAFLDADDEYTEDNLQRKHDSLNNDSSLGFVYSDIWKCDPDMKPLYVQKGVPADNLFNDVMLWMAVTIPGFSSNVMVRKESMIEKYMFDENISNCADRYMQMLLSKNLKGAYLALPLCKYRDTPGAMSKNISLLEHDEEYIIGKIKELNILPAGSYRKMIIANIYFTLSGSWYVNAKKPLRAIKYGFKSLFTYPPYIFRLLKKLVS